MYTNWKEHCLVQGSNTQFMSNCFWEQEQMAQHAIQIEQARQA